VHEKRGGTLVTEGVFKRGRRGKVGKRREEKNTEGGERKWIESSPLQLPGTERSGDSKATWKVGTRTKTIPYGKAFWKMKVLRGKVEPGRKRGRY